MIKYFIRTNGKRSFSYPEINPTILLDKNKDYIESFINQLEIISEYDAVLLEDDVKLCENFKDKIEQVIMQNPHTVINFFSKPYRYISTHINTEFVFNQCTYYPKGVAKQIATKMRELRAGRYHMLKQYDDLESMAMLSLCIPHLIYRPCLVQHKDTASLIGNGYNKTTIYFEDYLNQLGIKYEDAYTQENVDKLTKLLEEDKKTW